MLKPGAISTLALCLFVGACGNRPVPAPNLRQIAFPAPVHGFTSPSHDVHFDYPGNWALIPLDPPGVATVASGGASMTVWAYRAVAIVRTVQDAAFARNRLVVSLKRRDPGFNLSGATVNPFFKEPAVEIDGSTKIGGRLLGLRSVHFYKGRGEYVVDLLADPPVYSAANLDVLQPLLESIRFRGRPPVPNGATRSAASPSPAATPTGGR